MTPTAPLLSVRDLRVTFSSRHGDVRAVDGISFEITDGETVGLVGESGSGKSATALALLDMLGSHAVVEADAMAFRGRDILTMKREELRRLRGGGIGMVFQDATSALNPVLTVGEQLEEAIRAHSSTSKGKARTRARELLGLVGVSDPTRRLGQYPHQLSGGMRQRVMISIALSNEPALLIADEPTTALDVTIQAQILALLNKVSSESGTAILLITHNMGVVAQLCQRVLVMYSGKIVEEGRADEIFQDSKHPYSWGLIRSIPRLDDRKSERLLSIPGRPPDPRARPAGCSFHTRCAFAIGRCQTETPQLQPFSESQSAACWVTQDGERLTLDTAGQQLGLQQPLQPGAAPSTDSSVLLEVRGLVKSFVIKRSRFSREGTATVRAVNGVSLHVRAGETLGLVGESGCGKSTLARTIVGVHAPTAGEISFKGAVLAAGTRDRAMHRHIQMIFQDPYSSLNPRMTAGQTIAEPLKIHNLVPARQRATRVASLLETVGLQPRDHGRFPREFSGGQRQRIGIARALAVEPSVIVCDEPVSALDVSLQAQVVNLLTSIQEEYRLAYLFIAHDLAVIRHVSDRIAVMYLGFIVESGTSEEVCTKPLHPYTVSLLSAVPIPDPSAERARPRITLRGDLPSPLNPPSGCPFHTRCPVGPLHDAGRTICMERMPELVGAGDEHQVACHFPGELARFGVLDRAAGDENPTSAN